MSLEKSPQNFSSQLFRWIGKRAALFGPLGVLSYLLLLGAGIYGLFYDWPPTAKCWLVLKGVYGLVTIGAPLFFFCEYLVASGEREYESSADRSTRLLELKNIQDQGRAVWLACATVVGLILFKGG